LRRRQRPHLPRVCRDRPARRHPPGRRLPRRRPLDERPSPTDRQRQPMIKIAKYPGDLRFGFEVQMRVLGAVLMRELHTRFARDNIGYLWLSLEPMLLAMAISGIHLAVHARLPYGMEIVPFYLCGYTPFLMFRQIVNRAAATIESNLTLLYHRQISLFDLL